MEYRRGFWWDDGLSEKDIDFHFSRMRFAYHILDYCSGGVMVQAGSCVGLWPMALSPFFDEILSFEPNDSNFRAIARSRFFPPNIKFHMKALGVTNGEAVFIKKKFATGRISDTGEVPNGAYIVDQVSIDSLSLVQCSAIQLDIEGGELNALKGGKQTIERFKPVIQVEIFDEDYESSPVYQWLWSVGYKMVRKAGGDYIFTPCG